MRSPRTRRIRGPTPPGSCAARTHERIAELKRQPGADILMFGSGMLWNDPLAAGLVAEINLIIGAAVLAGGTPAFAHPAATPLRLLGTRTWDDSDNVLVQYASSRAAQA